MRRGLPVRLASLFFVLSIGTAPGVASAAFFQLAEQSVSGLGNAFAGGAASAHDASTVWYNPAGLTRLEGSQFAVAGHLILPSTKFKNQGPSTTVLGQPLTGGDGGDAGEDAFVPNAYWTRPINERLTFGLAVNVPFGLATEYDDGWKGRYHALESEIETININPAIGYKVSDKFSIGGGISLQQVDATLTSAIDFGTICTVLQAQAVLPAGTCAALGQVPQSNDGESKLTADDTAWGYNFGFLWQTGAKTRVGLHYRSKLDFKLDGKQKVTTPDAGTATLATTIGIVNSGLSADITLPATISASVFHELNERWAIMGDVTQTRWSDLPELRVVFDSGQSDSVITLDLDDVLRYSFGATFSPGGKWVYRFGAALDQTPAPNARARTPRLPDEDRTWLTFGASYKRGDRMSFDFAYALIAIEDAEIRKTTADPENTFRGNLVGEYDADVSIVSAQVNWKF